MKKHRIRWWILPVLLLTLPVAGRAQFTFTTNNGTILITGYTGPGGNVTIPGWTNGCPVTGLGDWAFFFCTSLTNLTIGNSVTNIGNYVFHYCASLTNVAIPNSVTCIGDGAFYDCVSLPGVTIPDSVTDIGDDAFAWCCSLSNVTIGNAVTSIGNEAFDSCSSLPGVTIPDSVTNVGDYAFAWCGGLTNVTIGNSVTNIGDYAFEGCALTGVTMPGSITRIGESAFYDCTSLTNVTIANSVTNIGDDAFSYCTNLLSVYFEGNAPAVGSSPFSGDNNVTVYYLPGTTGWTNTFAGCPAVLWNPSSLPPTLGSLVHRYSFLEDGGTNVADSVGGPVWTGTLPNGGTFSNGQLTLASNSSQYVSLPAGIVSTLSNFTIEVWAKLNSTADGARFFDFGNSTANYLFLAPQSGLTGHLCFGLATPGNSEQQFAGPSALSTGVWNHVAVTLNGNTGVLYLNGAAVATNSAMTLSPSGMGATTNNWLGRSEFSNPYLNGVLDEFRIYASALSPAEIAATDALGPGMTLSTNSPLMNLAVTDANLTLSWALECAGFALQSCTDLALGDWQTVTSPAPQIVGGQWEVSLPISVSNVSTFYRLLK